LHTSYKPLLAAATLTMAKKCTHMHAHKHTHTHTHIYKDSIMKPTKYYLKKVRGVKGKRTGDDVLSTLCASMDLPQ
jgi:hypothetical protein